MLNPEVVELVERFRRIELHAAHSGREVHRILVKILDESPADELPGLMDDLCENVDYLLPHLPPYAPPLNNINHVLILMEEAIKEDTPPSEVKLQCKALQSSSADPIANRETIAQSLVQHLPSRAVIYTHTLSETVLGVLLELHHLRRVERVVVTESRPNNDGWVSAQRLAESGLPTFLTVDAAMPAAICEADLMFSGAEIIHLDGSVVGKVGAYVAAVFCRQFQKPLYIIADSNKFNRIPWRDFNFNPITSNDLGLVSTLPTLDVTGTFFDITPAELITGYATEMGILTAVEIPKKVSSMRISAWLSEQLSQGQ